MMAFGKFPSFAKFIESYEAARQREAAERERDMTFEQRVEARRTERNIVEVDTTIDVREPDDVDGDKHYRLRVRIDDVLQGDPDVDADIKRCVDGRLDVFVAIRYGDRMGILTPIPGLDAGAKLRLKGEWIPRDQAQNHGGEKVSVLHFTHHPIGFTCTPQKCFS
jgi:endonuclease G